MRSGAGVVSYDASLNIDSWVSVSLGSVSNNVAEYYGAIIALERMERFSQGDCVLQMDSMLVTNQLRGRWRIMSSDLVPHYRKTSALTG